MRILGEAYNTPDKQEFYYFIRALDALETSLGGDNKTVILGADSELAKILNNALAEEEAAAPAVTDVPVTDPATEPSVEPEVVPQQ